MVRQVRIRYYAQLREALGKGSEEVELEFPARERDILERLAVRHPRQRDLFLASRVAVGDGYLEGIWNGNLGGMLEGNLEGMEALQVPDGVPAAGGIEIDIDIISPISGG